MQASKEKKKKLWYLRFFPRRCRRFRLKYRNILITLVLIIFMWIFRPLQYLQNSFSATLYSLNYEQSDITTIQENSIQKSSFRSQLPKLQSNTISAPHVDFKLVDGCYVDIPEQDTIRHIVTPPLGDISHLVCCETTQGKFTIAVHPSWAKRGAERFIDMVESKFFSTRVGLFRSLKGFLVQFGLAGDPAVQTTFHRKGNLEDDPQWLPLGPTGRVINGIKRYQKGYVGYAGAGKNSRGTQLILAYADNAFLGGGSPWEVPFGIVVGNDSFVTVSKFYTGYGEEPSQGKIMNQGAAYLDREFPKIDFITSCTVVARDIPYKPLIT